MKNKKLIAILTLLCFMFTLMPGAVFAADDETTPALTRTTALDLTSQGTMDKLIDEGWAWNNVSKTLTLDGLNLSVTSGHAITVPDGTTIILAEDSTNIIQTASSNDNCGIYAMGDLTIISADSSQKGTLMIVAQYGIRHNATLNNKEQISFSISNIKLNITAQQGINVRPPDSSPAANAALSLSGVLYNYTASGNRSLRSIQLWTTTGNAALNLTDSSVQMANGQVMVSAVSTAALTINRSTLTAADTIYVGNGKAQTATMDVMNSIVTTGADVQVDGSNIAKLTVNDSTLTATGTIYVQKAKTCTMGVTNDSNVKSGANVLIGSTEDIDLAELTVTDSILTTGSKYSSGNNSLEVGNGKAAIAKATITNSKITSIDGMGIAFVVNPKGEGTKSLTVSESTFFLAGLPNSVTIPAGNDVTTVTYSSANVNTDSNGNTILTVPASTVITSDGKTYTLTEENTVTYNKQTGVITISENAKIKLSDNTIITSAGEVVIEPGQTPTLPAEAVTTITINNMDNSSSIEITGPATVDADENGNVVVTVNAGGKIGTAVVPEGVEVTVPANKLDEVTTTGENAIILPESSTITSNGTTVEVVNGNVAVNDDGSIVISDNNDTKIGDTIITGPASVNTNGEVTVEAGGKINNGENGSYTVPEGTNIIIPESKLDEVTTDENGAVNIPAGTVMKKEDGTTQEFQYGGTIASDGTVTENAAPVKPNTGGGFSGTYNYPVSVPTADNGSVKLSDNNASAGETVTATVKPDNGYGVAEVIVTDEKGNVIPVTYLGNGEYSFVMPAGKVNIETVCKPAITLTIGSQMANVFGKNVKNDVAPIITAEGRTMLPIRFVAEALGADVSWNEDTQTVTITKDGTVVEIIIGADYAYINGKRVELDSPAFIANGRTYLPVRFVAEALGADVNWDADAKQVVIMK